MYIAAGELQNARPVIEVTDDAAKHFAGTHSEQKCDERTGRRPVALFGPLQRQQNKTAGFVDVKLYLANFDAFEAEICTLRALANT